MIHSESTPNRNSSFGSSIVIVCLITSLGIFATNCSENRSTGPNILIGPPTDVGFGVSGLLFENNLILWYRENSGPRTELFSQMYFTRLDQANFPVWGSFPSEHLVSGGVARDGILALVDPEFVEPNSPEASYLKDDDIVLGAIINGEAKAYPHNILWWHEVANDQIGGMAVFMTFCPLTGSGILFKTPANGNTVGQLTMLPVIETTWRKWKELYPDTKVISSQTGIDRDYTRYPYGDYRTENTFPLFSLRTASINNKFLPKQMVLGLIAGDQQKAYSFSRLSATPVVNDSLGNRQVLIVSDITEQLAISYDRRVNGQVLTFALVESAPFQMKDLETESIWNIKGEALSGPMAGEQLRQLPAYNAFWFAWAVFWPQTAIYGE